MKRQVSHQPCASGAARGSGRSAMTLIEILMAMGIFMLGVIGILTLFPVAIRNISIAVNRTIGAAVAKNAIASMRFFAIDLSVAPDEFATITDGAPPDTELKGQPGFSFSHAVRDYHLAAATDGRYLGHGVYNQDSFKIPGDVNLPASLIGGGGAYVAVPWHADFGWTATLRPMPKDDDGDGLKDEEPAGIDDDGDGSFGDDPPNIDDNTVYQAQIAVWRNYALIKSRDAMGNFTTGKFHPYGNLLLQYPKADAGKVYIKECGAGDPDLWNRVKPGDYIRHRGHGVWYQIAEVQPGTAPAPYQGQIILARAYSHPFAREAAGATLEGDVEFANRFRLVALYDTVIGPEQ